MRFVYISIVKGVVGSCHFDADGLVSQLADSIILLYSALIYLILKQRNTFQLGNKEGKPIIYHDYSIEIYI